MLLFVCICEIRSSFLGSCKNKRKVRGRLLATIFHGLSFSAGKVLGAMVSAFFERGQRFVFVKFQKLIPHFGSGLKLCCWLGACDELARDLTKPRVYG
jgi:hypothetical protein